MNDAFVTRPAIVKDLANFGTIRTLSTTLRRGRCSTGARRAYSWTDCRTAGA